MLNAKTAAGAPGAREVVTCLADVLLRTTDAPLAQITARAGYGTGFSSPRG